MRRHTAGSLTIAACALSWGVIAVVVRQLDMPAMAIVFFRVLLATVALATGLLLSGRRDLFRLPSRAVLGLGVLLASHWSFYFGAIQETSVASAVVITYAGPILLALLAPVMLREHVPGLVLGALAVSVAGIVLITLSGGSGEDAVRPLGVLLALLAAVSYAFLIVLLKKWASEVDPVTVVLYQSLMAAVVLSPAAVLADYSLGGADVAYLLLLGVVLTAGVGVIYVGALRSVPATTAGILAYMEPVSAALLAVLLLGESLTAAVVLGGAAIVAAGVAVVARGDTPPLSPAPAA